MKNNNTNITPLLELKGVSKSFPGVLALDNINFSLNPGEVHVLFGENGAGKSTAISIIAGVYKPTTGAIFFNNKPIQLQSVNHAKSCGINAVFQEFSLVGQLSVEQNLFLGREYLNKGLLDKKLLHTEAKKILQKLGFDIEANKLVDFLSRAQQQMVEIAKAFVAETSVLILDEPTASLTDKETNKLFELIAQIKAQGVGVIYITHRMAEIKKIADRVTVLRDGNYVDTVDAKTTTQQQLVSLMTGRVIEQIFPRMDFSPRQTILAIDGLTTKNNKVKNVSIHVRSGEIIGLAGLVGAGKSRLIRACFGIERVASGKVIFNDEDVTNFNTRKMLNRGFFYNPPNRHTEGLVMVRNCRENISLPALFLPKFSKWFLLRRKNEDKQALDLAARFRLQPFNIEREVSNFSGGNQQKVMLAKCMTRDVKLYVFDEPTVGVDVGTRVEIYKFITELCKNGAAVIVISSDLPEVLNLSKRLYVMHRGKIQAELIGDDINEANVLLNFFDKEAV